MQDRVERKIADHRLNHCHTCSKFIDRGETFVHVISDRWVLSRTFHVGCAPKPTLAETLTEQYASQPIDPDCVEDGWEYLACIFDGSLGLDYTEERLIALANEHGASIDQGEDDDREAFAFAAEEAEEYLNRLLENTIFWFTWHEGNFVLARISDEDAV